MLEGGEEFALAGEPALHLKLGSKDFEKVKCV